MNVFWPALIVGVVLLVSGALVLRNSAFLASWLGKTSGRVPGREGGDAAYTSRNAKAAGVGFLAIGALGIVLSFLNLNW
jgi:hypothetical protein